MDDTTAKQYMNLPEKTRGLTTLLLGDSMSEIDVNAILTGRFNKVCSDQYYGAYITNR